MEGSVLPNIYRYFFIPNYPSDIATVNFDRSWHDDYW